MSRLFGLTNLVSSSVLHECVPQLQHVNLRIVGQPARLLATPPSPGAPPASAALLPFAQVFIRGHLFIYLDPYSTVQLGFNWVRVLVHLRSITTNAQV